MKSYELTYIISSALTTDEVQNVVKDMESFIQSHEGVILSSEKTGAQPLAFPIKKQASGYFATTMFQAEEGKMKALKEKMGKEKEVLRSIILVKKPIKEMKERRTRKPLATAESVPGLKEKKVYEKMSSEDLDKKIDEILQ